MRIVIKITLIIIAIGFALSLFNGIAEGFDKYNNLKIQQKELQEAIVAYNDKIDYIKRSKRYGF